MFKEDPITRYGYVVGGINIKQFEEKPSSEDTPPNSRERQRIKCTMNCNKRKLRVNFWKNLLI